MQTAPSDQGSDRPLALRSVDRALAERYSVYVDEVQRLIQAAVAVMERDGVLDPKVTEIVGEAGLSNQTFYRHFKSKDELLLAILDDGLRQLVGYLEHQMAKEPTPRGRVRRWVEGIMAQAADPKASAATRAMVLNANRVSPLYPEETAQTDEPITALLRHTLSAAGSSDPARDARSSYRAVMGTMTGFLTTRRIPTAEDVEHLVNYVLSGSRISAAAVRDSAVRDSAVRDSAVRDPGI